MPNPTATTTLQRAMAEAKSHAETRGHEYVGPLHILLALASSAHAGIARGILTHLGAEPAAIATTIEEAMQPAAPPWGTTRRRSGVQPAVVELPYTSHAISALQHAMTLTTDLHSAAMGTGHMLTGLLHDAKSPAVAVFKMHAIAYDDALRVLTMSPANEE